MKGNNTPILASVLSRTRRQLLRALAFAATLTCAALGLQPAPFASAVTATPDSVSVDLGSLQGKPTYHASGTLYGMTEDGSGPPDQFYQGIDWHFERAGGAQLNSGGYAAGLADYQTRWASTLAQYKKTKELGGTFIILPHDLWGADGTTRTSYPGDNGDWTLFDHFVDQLIGDVKANHMTVEWDLWNEPNLTYFWNAPQDQYLQMWSRFYTKVRAAFPDQLIVGPSTAGGPVLGGSTTWWDNYLTYAKAHNELPDIYSWHDEPGDPLTESQQLNTLLAEHGLTNHRPIQINEYGAPNQQNPGGGAWFIARLERVGADGLRGNWAGGQGLHDDAAALLTKVDGHYLPLAEWWVYQAYARMSGHIAGTTPGADLDAYATVTDDKKEAQILVGDDQRATPSQAIIDITGSNRTNLADRRGRIRVVVQRFAYGGGRPTGGAITVSDTVRSVDSNGHLSLGIDYQNSTDAYLVTLLRPGEPTAFDGNLTITGDLPAAGTTSTVVTTFHNTAAEARELDPAQQLNAPTGWTVQAMAPTTTPVVAPGASFSTAWSVTAPAGAAGSAALLTAGARWTERGAPGGTFETSSWQQGTIACAEGQACELEQGTLAGGACTAANHPGYTGTGFVACFDSGPDRSATQQVKVPEAGVYTVALRYAAGPDGPATDRTMAVSVNGGAPQVITLPRTGSWDTWGEVATSLRLDAGVDSITYSDPPATTGWVNLDHLTVS